MRDDPIVAEVRKARQTPAQEFHYDLAAIYRDIKAKEKESGRQFVRHQPRPCTAEVLRSKG